MTTEEVIGHLSARLPLLKPSAPPVLLTGGLLNSVWRVEGVPASVIVKHAPDHLGVMPLDPFRLTIEARALAAQPGAPDPWVSVPRLLDFDAQSNTLVMEDMGALPALDAWLQSAPREAATAHGLRLGSFVGRLHGATAGQADLAARFVNLPMQQTRLAVQYESIGPSLAEAGIGDAEALGQAAVALGKALLRPGRSLVMGDLWPRSVLVAPGALRLIDWEMAHYGQPFQDTAHLAAHLWMLWHRGVASAQPFAQGFAEGYEASAPAEREGEARMGALHAACEIVVRVLGPFRSGYLYEDASPAVRAEALGLALRWMREGVGRRADLLCLG